MELHQAILAYASRLESARLAGGPDPSPLAYVGPIRRGLTDSGLDGFFQQVDHLIRVDLLTAYSAWRLVYEAHLKEDLEKNVDLCLQVVRLAYLVGSYSFSERLAKRLLQLEQGYRPRLELMHRRAKCARNLGHHTLALNLYADSLLLALNRRDRLAVARQTLMLGKMYGKYIGLASWAQALTSAAVGLLELPCDPLLAGDRDFLLAIAYDALGDSFALGGRRRTAEAFTAYRRSASLRKRMGYSSGSARPYCHQAMYWLQIGKPPTECLVLFNRGMSELSNSGWEEKGWAVRATQHAYLLALSGADPWAMWTELESAIAICRKLNNYRYVSKALIYKARVLDIAQEFEREIACLDEAGRIAAKYRHYPQLLEAQTLLREAYRQCGDPVSAKHKLDETRAQLAETRERIGSEMRRVVTESWVDALQDFCTGETRTSAIVRPRTFALREAFYSGLASDYDSTVASLLGHLSQASEDLARAIQQSRLGTADASIAAMLTLRAREMGHSMNNWAIELGNCIESFVERGQLRTSRQIRALELIHRGMERRARELLDDNAKLELEELTVKVLERRIPGLREVSAGLEIRVIGDAAKGIPCYPPLLETALGLLIENADESVARRSSEDPSDFEGRILVLIQPETPRIIVADDGIGPPESISPGPLVTRKVSSKPGHLGRGLELANELLANMDLRLAFRPDQIPAGYRFALCVERVGESA